MRLVRMSSNAASVLLLALVSGMFVPVTGVAGRVSFALESVGTADACSRTGADWLPERLRTAEYGRALLLSREYFLGAMNGLRPVFDIREGAATADYKVALRFSDLGCVESTNVTALGSARVKVEKTLTMNAVVSDGTGRIAFSRNFEETLERQFDPQARPFGADNAADKLIRKCLASLAVALKREFAAVCRFSVRKPDGVAEFNADSIRVCVDGEQLSSWAEVILGKGAHSIRVTADGCLEAVSQIRVKEDMITIIKLERKQERISK